MLKSTRRRRHVWRRNLGLVFWQIYGESSSRRNVARCWDVVHAAVNLNRRFKGREHRTRENDEKGCNKNINPLNKTPGELRAKTLAIKLNGQQTLIQVCKILPHLNFKHFAGRHAVWHLHLYLVAGSRTTRSSRSRSGHGERCPGGSRHLQKGVQVAPHPRLHHRHRYHCAEPLVELSAALFLGAVSEAEQRPDWLLSRKWSTPSDRTSGRCQKRTAGCA